MHLEAQMRSTLICILLLLLVPDVSMAWDDTLYDTVDTKWSDGKQKEFITRYWFTGNEKGYRPHGQYSTWHENGRLKEDSYYDRNTPVGALIKWSEDGGRTEEAVLIDGKRHGMYIEWHSDRNIKILGHYKYGRRHGLWTFRRSGGDMNNFLCYIDSIHFYYEDTLAVRLERPCGVGTSQEKTYYNDELQMWVEWEKHNSIDWMNNYLWFDLGLKIEGQKVGKWVRLNHGGEIIDIDYFSNGESVR